MASNPEMEYQVFSLHFPKELGYGLLNWDSQQGRPFSLPSKRNFPIFFKPKLVIAKFIGKMKKKSGIVKSGLDAMPLFLLYNLLSDIFLLAHRVKNHLFSYHLQRPLQPILNSLSIWMIRILMMILQIALWSFLWCRGRKPESLNMLLDSRFSNAICQPKD